MWEDHPAYQKVQVAVSIESEHCRVPHAITAVMGRLGCQGLRMAAAAETVISRARTTRYAFVLAVLFVCVIRCSAAELDFYGLFTRLVDTNDWRSRGVTNALLVDANNRAPKLTNSVLSLQKLRTEGEVGDVRLGMTMEEVVNRWGKPVWLHPRCDGGHKFNFTDASLVFVGNRLDKVRLPLGAVFDRGVSASSDFQKWQQVLGTPTLVNKGSNGSTVLYEHVGKVRTVLLLSFEPDGEVRFPPAIYLDPPLTNWFRKVQP